jgi:citronellol/citronellal dehydrogenase
VGDLHGKTIVMSGGSRGLGLGVAYGLPQMVRTWSWSRRRIRLIRSAGTIHSAAEQIRQPGGGHRRRHQVRCYDRVRRGSRRVGVLRRRHLPNHASVLNLAGTLALEPQRYDLMQDVNAPGTFMLTKACLPHLLQAPDPHVLTFSPPLTLEPRWLAAFPGYML